MAGRKKKKKTVRTVRPAADAAPVVCYRFGATVLVRAAAAGAAVLTPAEARALAARLLAEAELADGTPLTGVSSYATRLLPDD